MELAAIIIVLIIEKQYIALWVEKDPRNASGLRLRVVTTILLKFY